MEFSQKFIKLAVDDGDDIIIIIVWLACNILWQSQRPFATASSFFRFRQTRQGANETLAMQMSCGNL